MPTKVKDVIIAYGYKVYSTYYSPALRTTSFNTVKLLRRTTGVSNPYYRKQISEHANATTSMSGQYDFLDLRPFEMHIGWNTTPGQIGHPREIRENIFGDVAAGGVLPVLTGDYGSLSEAINTAYIRFQKKVAGMNRQIEGGVVIGELRETLHMLRAPAKALLEKLGEYVGTVNKRSRAARNKPKSMKKVIADTWLEYAFGWAPFFNDISDACKLYKEIGRKETFQKISVGANVKRHVAWGGPNTGIYQDYLRSTETARWYEEAHVRIKGEVRLRAITNTQAVLQNAGLTFDQFVPTVWELLPWSFLVDYFSNIGDILQYDNRVFTDLAWHCIGTKKDLVKEYLIQPNIGASAKILGNAFVGGGGSPGYAKSTSRIVSRYTDSAIGSFRPSLQFELPGLDRQKLNIAALLASANTVHPQSVRR